MTISCTGLRSTSVVIAVLMLLVHASAQADDIADELALEAACENGELRVPWGHVHVTWPGPCSNVVISTHWNEVTVGDIDVLSAVGSDNIIVAGTIGRVKSIGERNIVVHEGPRPEGWRDEWVDEWGNQLVTDLSEADLTEHDNATERRAESLEERDLARESFARRYGRQLTPDGQVARSRERRNESPRPAATTEQATARPAQSVRPADGKAPPLYTLPGPQVALSKEMLSDLPAGYRVAMVGTYTWVAADMSSSTRRYMTLTGDGQFEVGSSSSTSAMNGAIAVQTESNKNGSVGSVFGSNPGVGGAEAVGLVTRDGLDPSKYGTYYISGNRIELRYANGETRKLPFRTDGTGRFFLGDDEYFTRVPAGWQKLTRDGVDLYRSVDGGWRVAVSGFKGDMGDPVAVLEKHVRRRNAEGVLVSASPVETYPESLQTVAKTSTVLKDGKGGEGTVEVYARQSSNSQIKNFTAFAQRYDGGRDSDLLSFVQRLR